MFTKIRLLLRQHRSIINIKFSASQKKKSVLIDYNARGLERRNFFTTRSGNNNLPTISVIEYEEIKSLSDHPEKLLIDVREPKELEEFGRIPASINIPLGELSQALGLSANTFKEQFGREKPSPTTEVIFHCKSGKRSSIAAKTAVSMGYENVKNYAGSWNDWATQNKLPK